MFEGFARALKEFHGILFDLDSTLARLRREADFFEAFKKLSFAVLIQLLFFFVFLVSFGALVFFCGLTGFDKYAGFLKSISPIVYASLLVVFFKYPVYFGVWLFSLVSSFSLARFLGGRQSFKQAFAHWCYFYYFGFIVYFLIAFFHEGFVTPIASTASYYLFVLTLLLFVPFLVYLTSYSVRINNNFSHKKAFAIQLVVIVLAVALAFLAFYAWFSEPLNELVLRLQ
ncbi:hypothetical protein HY992_01620 [Candidatus Micrarchaeota archaeon]|nr:hypothetical protein [Candidatus Micrarchaeota archaeon]